MAKSADPSLGAFFAKETKASLGGIAALRDKMQPMLTSEAEKAAFAKILQVREPYSASRDKITKLKQEGSHRGSQRGAREGVRTRGRCLPGRDPEAARYPAHQHRHGPPLRSMPSMSMRATA
ncbi:MCP four helix bundle domain-containing protein [Cupriavidus basilensis]